MSSAQIATTDIITRVSLALDSSSGDFPLQRRSLDMLKLLSQHPSPNIEKVLSTILADPILCIKALQNLSLTGESNSFNLRELINLFSVSPLQELGQSTILINDYREIARNNPIFLDQLRKSVFTGLLADLLTKEWGLITQEELLVASAVLCSSNTLLSYYYPQLYRDSINRAHQLEIRVNQSIQQKIGMPLIGLSMSTAHSLCLPEKLLHLLEQTNAVLSSNKDALQDDSSTGFQAQALAVSFEMAHLLSDSETVAPTRRKIEELAVQFEISESQLIYCVEQLPLHYADFCKNSTVPSMGLPVKLENLLAYGGPTESFEGNMARTSQRREYSRKMNQMVRAGGSARGLIGCALEAIVDDLPFNRAILLLPDQECKRLYGCQLVGAATPLDHTLIALKLNKDSYKLEATTCFIEGRIVTQRGPISSDSTLSACIPIGLDRRTIGVIVAERISSETHVKEVLGESVMKELRILTACLHDCLLSLESSFELETNQI